MRNEHLNCLRVFFFTKTPEHGCVEHRVVIGSLKIDPRAALKKKFHDFQAAELRRGSQRRP